MNMDVASKKALWWMLFAGNLLAILLFWWDASGPMLMSGSSIGVTRALGRITGLLGEFFILMEIVLISRIVPLEQTFGFDKLNKFHRWIGYFIGIAFIAHPLLIAYAMGNGANLWEQFINVVLADGDYTNAFIALCLFVIVILFSYAIVRKRLRYETWYFVHLLTYFAIGLVFGHQIKSTDFLGNKIWLYYWYVINFGIFGIGLFFRWAKPYYAYLKHGFVVDRIVAEAGGVWSVYISGKKMDQYHFLPGQYANLTFFAKGLWFTHPFSFSKEWDGKQIRFSVKALGDFTNRMGEIPVGTRVFIDGPLGRFVEDVAVKKKFLFIAGGIGVTPLRALAGDMAPKGRDIVMIYGNRTVKDTALRAEFDELIAKYPNMRYCIVCSDPAESDPTARKGFIDANCIKDCVPDFLERDVYLCGPPVMMDAVTKALKGLGMPSNQVHFEKFSY